MAELVFCFATEILENHLALNQPSDRRIAASFTAHESGSLLLYQSFGVYFLCLSPFTPPYVARWMCCLPLLFCAPRWL